MRASSLQATNILAINREIDSKYDTVLAVKEKLPEIELVADMDIDALILQLEQLQNFTGITVVAGDVAGFDPVTKIITVPTVKGDTGSIGPIGPEGGVGPIGPRGLQGLAGRDGINGTNGRDGAAGINGLNGMVPVIEFSLDNNYNLLYDVVGYEEGPTLGERFPTQEW